MTRYAVFGQPIAHSLSPRIHALFGAQFGIAVDYCAIEAGRDDFARRLDAFARDGGAGANVTLPLKADAFALCAARSERAQRCGSVNTVTRDGDAWRGDSTDGVGFLRDLARLGFDPRDRRVLLLGAGGAARAVAFALADAGVHELMIVNRTRERTRDLVRALRCDGVFGCDLAQIATLEGRYGLLVNATSAGHAGAAFELPARLLERDALCYDLSYGGAARSFLAWARESGAKTASDGLGMLVEQAAESFAIWHGRRPDAGAVLAELRADPPH